MSEAEYSKPVPIPAEPELTRPFWEAAKRHDLVIPRCGACGRFFFYPRHTCPHCMASDWEWTPVSGSGRVYSFTLVRRPADPSFAGDVPYAYAVVELDEGPRMVTGIVDCPLEAIEINMPVQVRFDDVTPEWTLVKFAPA